MDNSLWRKIQPHAIAVAVFFLVSCIYCLPALKGLVVAQHDVTGWKGMAQQSLEFKEKYGHYPLWTNSIFSGMPAFQIMIGSTFNITIAYLHYLFMLFLPQPAGLFFLACIGFYILCMSLGVRSRIAILGSLAYAFASYSAVIVAVGHTSKFSSMGYMPAVIAGLILLYQRKYLLGFITTLVFSTQLFYQNHVQIAYYTILVAACVTIVYGINAFRNKEASSFLKGLGLAAVGGIMGMLSYAVVLFPTYDYTKETMRGGRSELIKPGDKADKSKGGLDKSYAFGYSYGIAEVLTIVSPRLYGGSSSELPAGSKTASTFAEKTGMGEEQADQFAKSLPAYWGPQGMTSGAVYLGAAICILFIFGLVYYKDLNKQWIIAATILGILLAWGKSFSTFNYFLFDHLPFYNKFRAPSMAMVIPQLTFPLLAVLGLSNIFDSVSDKEIFWKKFKVASIATGVVAALMVVLYLSLDFKNESDAMYKSQLTNNALQQMSQGKPTPEVQQRAEDLGRSVFAALKDDRRSMYGSDLFRSIIFMAITLGLLYVYAKNKINNTIATIALTAVVFIDLIGVDLRYLNSDNYVEPELFQDAFTPTAADLQISRDTSYYRVFNNSDGDPFQLSGATPRTSYLHNSVGGYHPAKLALYNDLIFEQLAKGNMQVFDMLNTKYFITSNPTGGQQPVVQKNPAALGPVWFIKGIKYVNNANEEMRALDEFKASDTAIVDKREQSKIPFTPQADSNAKIRLTEHLNDEMHYTSSSSTNEFAVFSEIYYPNGWKAFIDGKEVPIVKTNYVLRGLSIPAGNHNIIFKFDPLSYRIGNYTSMVVGALSILILIYGAFVLWKNYKKETSPAITR